MASDSKAKLLREGERYVQKGKITEAISEYLKVLKSDPEDVLTLNTIGDLYLRQRRFSEAKQIFLQVAESYARNNFLLKAIAVYKKILASESDNLEVNLLVASLYARQGMNIDARSQYLRVAELHSQQGKIGEALEAYEKVVEIDPMNTGVLLKLAEAYSSQGSTEKAHAFFSSAACAQAKNGDLESALVSLQKASGLAPSNRISIGNFLETALQAGNVSRVLDPVKQMLGDVSDDGSLAELLGRSHLAVGDLANATKSFLLAFHADETRYEHLLSLSKAYVKAGDIDRAVRCLDTVIPVLINRHETGIAIQHCNEILEANPDSVAALEMMTEIYSATNNEYKYVETVERLLHIYMAAKNHEEALGQIEKLLQVNPHSEKHLKMHREVFQDARPDAPYELPAAVREAHESDQMNLASSLAGQSSFGDGGDEESSSMIEIDLLLNYGMRDKALKLLQALELKDPGNTEARSRLLSLYREAGDPKKAAEQCVLLAALHESHGEEAPAQKYLAEAKTLAPDWLSGIDFREFANAHGISAPVAFAAGTGARGSTGTAEVDLSGDLSEIFFKDLSGYPDEEEGGRAGFVASPTEAEFAGELSPGSSDAGTIEEQLQEVDFYIRLGFSDEAMAKLDEISQSYPDHPELESRYRQLSCEGQETASGGKEAAPANLGTILGLEESEESAAENVGIPAAGKELDLLLSGTKGESGIPEKWIDLNQESQAETGARADFQHDEAPSSIAASNSGTSVRGETDAGKSLGYEPPKLGEEAGEPLPDAHSGAQDNVIFSDLMDEVNSLGGRGASREDYETRFSLGIAYREMGLLEEAIKEFEGAIKALDSAASPKEFIQCCGMLSTCFLERGMARSCLRWCQTGLRMADISSHEAMALRYDMGVAHSVAGETERALRCFGEIFGIDPGYRDVAQRIDDLKSGIERHAP